MLNRVNIIDYAVEGNRIKGAYGIGIENDTFYIIEAKAVIIATGGAAGLYKPNNPDFHVIKCGIRRLIRVPDMQWV